MQQLISYLQANGIDIWGIVKWPFVLAFVLALVFALVVVRQVQLMAKTLDGTMSPFIHLIGWGLVLVAGIGLVMSLAVL